MEVYEHFSQKIKNVSVLDITSALGVHVGRALSEFVFQKKRKKRSQIIHSGFFLILKYILQY
jgi:predicted RecA/RadA family phage recombinase